MSKREDIIDPDKYRSGQQPREGLIYSEVLGWIDLGHARGDDIRAVLNQFTSGERSGKPYYLVTYQQLMSMGRISTGRFCRWNIKHGRSQQEQYSILLAMMMQTATAFENWQSMPFFSWYTDSGFSGEDLVSDLLGFYKAIIPRNYWPELKPVSKEAALRRWDYYGPIGNYKNKGFRPLLFPDPQNKTVSHTPYKSNLPDFMTRIQPFSNFSSDNVRIFDKASVVNIINGVRID